MANFFTVIHLAFSLVSPFLLLHFLSQYYYNLSLWDIVRWWSGNYSNVNDAGFYFIGLFFIYILIFLTFSAFINILYLGLFGEKQDLVYLGHSKQSTAVYYNINDVEKKLITAHDSIIKYNYSFDDLYRAQTFIKDPGLENSAGTKSNNFHILGLLAVCVGVIVFTLAGAAFFNVFVYPVYHANPTDVNLPTEGAEIAFDSILARYNLTQEWYYGSVFVLLFVWVGFMLATPKNKLSAPVIPLPTYIRSVEIIEGIPNEIKIHYIKVPRSGDSDSYDKVDSGKRYITFEFIKGFTHVVYVTTLIDKNKQPELVEKIEHKINHKLPMTVIINDDLSIKIAEQAY